MTSNDCHASPAGLEVCLRCKKGAKGNEAGLECDLCHYWFHTKCEGVGRRGRYLQGTAKV